MVDIIVKTFSGMRKTYEVQLNDTVKKLRFLLADTNGELLRAFRLSAVRTLRLTSQLMHPFILIDSTYY